MMWGQTEILAMVYSQNLSLNSVLPSDKVRPSVRAMPAINRVACQMCVSATLQHNQLQIRSAAAVWSLVKHDRQTKCLSNLISSQGTWTPTLILTYADFRLASSVSLSLTFDSLLRVCVCHTENNYRWWGVFVSKFYSPIKYHKPIDGAQISWSTTTFFTTVLIVLPAYILSSQQYQ